MPDDEQWRTILDWQTSLMEADRHGYVSSLPRQNKPRLALRCAAGIAKDAQENLAGLDVVSVGNIFADDVAGERYLQVYIVLPDRAGDDFVVHLITLAHVQDILLAQINRTALIMALEAHFGRVQIFGDELAFAKYCQKEWPDEHMKQVVTGIISKRGLN